MIKKGVTLRGIEVFEALASCGSVAQAADITGLSQPAVSQQISNLETAIGVALLDHGRRPMRLTAAGESFLRRTASALTQLRLAQSELTVMDLANLTDLSLGVIDDFDNDLTPRLATMLADSMAGCRFRMVTDSSKALIQAVQDKTLHIVIAATSGDAKDGLIELPLARDPFIMVTPSGYRGKPGDLLAGTSDLPFLRYESHQLIADQIANHLTRSNITIESQFEIGSHLALMSMVARGIGWAITTPFGFARAERFHTTLQAHPLPSPGVSRQISLFAGADWTGPVPQNIATAMRQMLHSHMIAPLHTQLPWLAGSFHTLEG
ncbi:LysR family transcriptional regulator [Roseobacter sp. GAI101]|uniref:LysR family transcriptional regulator n=1 Tax=Roseobacter sp. (strain GAI101) TaxID=391589 RepID=UPI0001871C0F|nr:LysR family transcriptional regulator [Roseobacter sp. GAI101]EEB86282.1 transcriptional regulator, LysR family [Roseobacter sp. GAI101]